MTTSAADAPPPVSFATVDVRDHVAEVSLVARGKASRQGPDFWNEMPGLFAWLDASDAVHTVLVRGEGDGFSYGLDLMAMAGELASLTDPAGGARMRTRLHELIRRMQEATTAVARCRKPVIAAIHGWCIGAGIDLASACDVRVCSADARFSVREVKLAIVADVGSLARLPAIIGQGATRELAFSGDDIDAARALRLGLVSEVYPDRDRLFQEARALASRIAQNPPLVVQGVKQILNLPSEAAAAASLQSVATWNAAFLPSQDLREAIGAFAERREPKFRGE